MNVTLDTNCIVALQENEPDAPYLRRIVQSAARQELKLRVVAISASERQRDGGYSENFSTFRHRIAEIGLGGVEILPAPCILGMTYLDYSILVSDQFREEAGRIHEILWPNIPFEYKDFCAQVGRDPEAPALDHRWRNPVIDTLVLWTHVHNGGGVLVTADKNFHRPTKKAALARLVPGQILRPSETADQLCS